MPSLPPPLRSGDPITTIAPWSAKVIDYLRAITVRPSATVSVSTTANGTLLSAAAAQPTVRRASAESSLNQFRVSAILDPDTAAAEAAASASATEHGQTYEPTMRYWLVSMAGGTAQAMFGTITPVPGVTDSRVFLRKDSDELCRCYVSLVYRVSLNGEIVHAFDSSPLIGTSVPVNTDETFHFPVAVVEFDGTVLQGHLGAVYLARPWNVVEAPDEETEEGYVE